MAGMATILKNSLAFSNMVKAKMPVVTQPHPVVASPATPSPVSRTEIRQKVNEEIILKRGGIFTVNDGYDYTQSQAFLAAQVGTQTFTVISTQVPLGSDLSLLITDYANDLSDVAAWSLFTWNMYIDGVPVQSYYNVADQLGQVNLMRKVGVDILVNAGQTLTVDIVGAANLPAVGGGPNSYSAIISLKGVYGIYDYNRD